MTCHSSPQCSLRLFLLFFATIFQLATSAILLSKYSDSNITMNSTYQSNHSQLLSSFSSAGLHTGFFATRTILQLDTAAFILFKCSHSNFTMNSTYQSNRSQLLSNLSSAAWRTGFSLQTLGEAPDQVFGHALCLISVNSFDCQTCLLNAVEAINIKCEHSIRAGLWYDNCFLRYADTNSMTSDEKKWSETVYAPNYISNPDKFEEVYSNLMGSLADGVANSTNLYKVDRAKYTGNITMYGLVQCTRDISLDDCYTCSKEYISKFQAGGWGRGGGAMLGFRCYIRMEIYPYFSDSFIDATSPALPPELPSLPKKNTGKKKPSIGTILRITMPLLLAFVVIAGLCFYILYRRKFGRTKPLLYVSNPEEMESIKSLLLDLSVLRVATTNFAEENKVGEGGFGVVYKGILPDGRQIAVKRLSQSSSQGLDELKNELILVAKLQHKNLVKLLGVCLEGQEKLLVYEYVPNKSLDQILFDTEKRHLLDWGKRYRIICGITRGLLYLHEESQFRVIHRDLKASNILLDSQMNPKISDFGLARLFGGDQTQEITSRVVGTYGYMAPEYAMQGHFSIKSDVFSYGVLVLEIITGKTNSSFLENDEIEILLSFVWRHWTNGTITEIVDPSLGQHYPRSELLRCTQIALLCVQENKADRPTMSNVAMMLSSETMYLETPSRPAFCIVSNATVMLSIRARMSVPVPPNVITITDIGPR